MRRTWQALAVVAAMVATVTGCSGGGSANAGDDGKTVVDWVMIGANNPFWDAEIKGAQEAARRGNFTFNFYSGNNSATTQASLIRQRANQNADVILVDAIDPATLGPAIKYAQDRGVRVVSTWNDAKGADMLVQFDEHSVGEAIAKEGVRLLELRNGSPSGEVAILQGVLGQTVNETRGGGFTDYLSQYPDIKVVAEQPTDWLAANANSAMTNWLTRFPELSLVYGLSDTITVPAITAAERAGKVCNVKEQSWQQDPSCILFSSVDGDPIGIQAIQAGTLGVTGMYAPTWAGYQFASLSHQLVTGDIKPGTVDLASYIVTPLNADCVAGMQSDMSNKTEDFPFDKKLEEIAGEYNCPAGV
jgi:ABC-type sugar transport system substrate-binding protein